MRTIALVAVLVACGRSRPAQPERGWWCWPDTACFAMRDQCERAAKEAGVRSPCVMRATAFCASGCSTLQPGARPICSAMCAVDRKQCEMLAKPGPCVATPLPMHPELQSDYVDPGFWCWTLTAPNGVTGSECVKHREQCEYDLADTLSKLGQAAGSVTCARATTKPTCFSWKINGDLAFVCALDKPACDSARNFALAPTTPTDPARTAPTECVTYPYD